MKRMFSGVFYLHYILGQWVVAEGLVYEDFNEEKHVISREKVNEMIRNNKFHT